MIHRSKGTEWTITFVWDRYKIFPNLARQLFIYSSVYMASGIVTNLEVHGEDAYISMQCYTILLMGA